MGAFIVSIACALRPLRSVDNLLLLDRPEAELRTAPPWLTLCNVSTDTTGFCLTWKLLIWAQRSSQEPGLRTLPGQCRHGTLASGRPRRRVALGQWLSLAPQRRMLMTPRAPVREDSWQAPLRTNMFHRHRWAPSRQVLHQRFQCLILLFHMFDPREAVWAAALCGREECHQRDDLLHRRDRLHRRRLGSRLTQQEEALHWQVLRRRKEVLQLCQQACYHRARSLCLQPLRGHSPHRRLTLQRSLRVPSPPLPFQLGTILRYRRYHRRLPQHRRLRYRCPKVCRYGQRLQHRLDPGRGWSSLSPSNLLHRHPERPHSWYRPVQPFAAQSKQADRQESSSLAPLPAHAKDGAPANTILSAHLRSSSAHKLLVAQVARMVLPVQVLAGPLPVCTSPLPLTCDRTRLREDSASTTLAPPTSAGILASDFSHVAETFGKYICLALLAAAHSLRHEAMTVQTALLPLSPVWAQEVFPALPPTMGRHRRPAGSSGKKWSCPQEHYSGEESDEVTEVIDVEATGVTEQTEDPYAVGENVIITNGSRVYLHGAHAVVLPAAAGPTAFQGDDDTRNVMLTDSRHGPRGKLLTVALRNLQPGPVRYFEGDDGMSVPLRWQLYPPPLTRFTARWLLGWADYSTIVPPKPLHKDQQRALEAEQRRLRGEEEEHPTKDKKPPRIFKLRPTMKRRPKTRLNLIPAAECTLKVRDRSWTPEPSPRRGKERQRPSKPPATDRQQRKRSCSPSRALVEPQTMDLCKPATSPSAATERRETAKPKPKKRPRILDIDQTRKRSPSPDPDAGHKTPNMTTRTTTPVASCPSL